MGNEFGGPSPTQTFLSSLAASTLGTFKTDHDKRMADEQHAKEMDYQLLMAAMKQMEPNMTPSQVKEIMTRGVDIFKPKGHGGIKEQLSGLFGGSESTYSPQSGNIINDVMGKPVANVQVPEQPVTGDNRARTVTVPPPPQYTPELTNRELDVQDKAATQEQMLKRQLALEDVRTAHRKEEWQTKNATLMDDFMQKTKERDRVKAERDVSDRAAIIANQVGGDYRDPEIRAQASAQLQSEIYDKHELIKSRMDQNRARIQKMSADVANARTRLQLQAQGLGLRQEKMWNDNAQVKGGWKKVDQYKNEAQRLRVLAATAYKEQDMKGAEAYGKQAEEAETSMQGVINSIEQKLTDLGTTGTPGQVRLKDAPTGHTVSRKAIDARAAKEGISSDDIIKNLPKGYTVVD